MMKMRFCDRLCQLIDERINEKNSEIKEKNRILCEKDNLRLAEWKNKIQRGDKPTPSNKYSEYTNETLMSEFENKYNVSMYRSKLGQYKNGKTVPPEEIIHYFADFFHVSYDYMIGNSNVRNYDTAKLNDILQLDDKALETLISLNNNETALCIMNALLHNADSTQNMLMNLYMQAYKRYKEENASLNHSPYYDSQPTLEKIAEALSLYDYIHELIKPFVSNQFSKDLYNETEAAKWEHEHPEEVQDEIINALKNEKEDGQ